MNNTIHYLNTDLDLVSQDDLTELGQAFERAGASPLFILQGEGQLWRATLETDRQHQEPESNISQMLDIIESLPDSLHTLWANCTVKEFNLGYDCGVESWAFNQGLSAELLRRLVHAGASVRITLSPHRKETAPEKSV